MIDNLTVLWYNTDIKQLFSVQYRFGTGHHYQHMSNTSAYVGIFLSNRTDRRVALWVARLSAFSIFYLPKAIWYINFLYSIVLVRFRLWFFLGFSFSIPPGFLISFAVRSPFRQGRGSIDREKIAIIPSEVCRCQREVLLAFSTRKNIACG